MCRLALDYITYSSGIGLSLLSWYIKILYTGLVSIMSDCLVLISCDCLALDLLLSVVEVLSELLPESSLGIA